MRGFVLVASVAAVAVGCPPGAVAQPDGKIFRIGAVSAGSPRATPHWIAFEERLRELGYVDKRNIAIEFRNADGNPAAMPSLMAGLAQHKVDVILAPGPEAALRAARDATSTIPIVVIAIDYDPIALGYVGGLARPGGNVTGVFMRQVELTDKRVALLKELLPQTSRVAVFWDQFSTHQISQAEGAARKLGLELDRFEFRHPPYDFEGVVKTARQRSTALLGLASPVFFRQRADLADALLRHRLPAIAPFREMAEAGVLMSYGADLPHMFRRAADYIDRILKGARAFELPMEQPTKFEFVVNNATAKALGVTVPPSLQIRADHIIDR